MRKTDTAKILATVWHDLSTETVEALAKAGLFSLVKLMGRVHQTPGINGIDQPDPDVIKRCR